MISVKDLFAGYAGNPGITPEHEANAEALLENVNDLLLWAVEEGWRPQKNPATGTYVSGQTDGGWRPQDCATGAPNSAHKQGKAVDVFDRSGELDAIITDEMLENFGLFREAPSATSSWCHLQDRPTKKRTFQP